MFPCHHIHIMLLSDTAVRTSYDDDVFYEEQDLQSLGLIDGRHRNRSKIQGLHSGAIWELHKRLSELEKKLS